ncbi:MAG: DUF2029 domain-containing protein [Candidatus Eisenbacteria bacterium]|nr:DUF2029 domain-containing protein [Candidatus Eisenbacteria bacterium]MCC7142060.1 DUF2029 domain-containing protein [Candidatus Eisenbacteria bacterium]
MLGLVLLGLVATVGVRRAGDRVSDFAGYWTAGRVLIDGKDLSRIYDDRWFGEASVGYGTGEPHMLMYVNPPAIAALFASVAWLPPTSAKWLWLGLSTVLLLAAWLVWLRALRVPLRSFPSFALLVLLAGGVPFLRTLERGQIYPLILLLVGAFVLGRLRTLPRLSGVSLAGLLLLKYFGGLFALYLFVRRDWKALQTMAITLFAASGIGALLLGPSTYVASLQRLFRSLVERDAAGTGLPNLIAFFGGFLTPSQWNAGVLLDAPWLALLLSGTTLFALVWSTLGGARAGAAPETELFPLLALLNLSVLFTPLAADHHYLLLVPSAWVLLLTQPRPNVRDPWLAVLVCTVLSFGLEPSVRAYQRSGWAKLLCYPTLYGAIGLTLLTVRRAAYGKTGSGVDGPGGRLEHPEDRRTVD